jgi:hypothetical protein
MFHKDFTLAKLFQTIANKGLLRHTQMHLSSKQLLITKGIEQISLLIDLNLNLNSRVKDEFFLKILIFPWHKKKC